MELGATCGRPRHGNSRFVTCTASGDAARSTVDALTLRAVTRTLLLDHVWTVPALQA